MLGERVYRKRHNVEAKWPDLSRARPEIHSGYSQLTFEKRSHLSRVVGKGRQFFLSPGEKGEGLSVYRCLPFVKAQMVSTFQFASGLLYAQSSSGVAFVRCPPSALRSWFARWAAHSLECLERFLPDRPAFCSRRKLAIISCAQKLDMNITRIIQHKGRARI